LAGLLPAHAGKPDKANVTIGSQRPEEARQSGRIGFVFQDLKLLPFLSVRDNLIWAARRLRKHDPEVEKNIGRVLRLVGLAEWAEAPLKNLSGGMKARLALARALLSSPELLLLDEALASLDIGWRLHLYDELSRLRDEFGLTIVIISHDLEDIARIADRIIVLSHGGEVAGIIGGELEHRQKIELMSNLILNDHPSRSKNA
jgi:molybdate transport system ATP-binding protein